MAYRQKTSSYDPLRNVEFSALGFYFQNIHELHHLYSYNWFDVYLKIMNFPEYCF